MAFSHYIIIVLISLLTLRKIEKVERKRIELKEKVGEINDSNRV